ncbi:hypothetical protein F7725_019257 [Dissostichus mawsoni]|uniref:E3 SUMO-protein ligase KIAA1586-like n=1 Tax=Dissostichus mawsoni TaxID=36200 RepID=A0A7J5YMJ9_DISMA|nr:hypothetical protein F7725_019257 [Dissostichus mawsoni]
MSSFHHCAKNREHKNSAAHNEAVKILQTANKDILLNMNASSQESVFESTAKPICGQEQQAFTDFESLIDLQHANSADLGRFCIAKLLVLMETWMPIAFPLDLVELDKKSSIGFCSDGASVMLGVKSGVGKLLQDDFPGIILWHCLNHRLELAVDQAWM